MNPIEQFFHAHPGISANNRAIIREAAAKMVQYYRLPDKTKELIPYQKRNDTSMIKWEIISKTSLSRDVRIDLGHTLDRLVYQVGVNAIAEDVVMVSEEVMA